MTAEHLHHCATQLASNTMQITNLYLFIIFLKVRLYTLTLYQATDCAAVTDISGVTVCCQLSR